MTAPSIPGDLLDEFDLDVNILTDPSQVAAPCKTDDGCKPTCASACTSNA
ncbi:FxLD family lanthipeptide [Sciscionella marina]